MVIHVSITICECDFSKQNRVRNEWRSRMKFRTLDAFMKLSLYGKKIEL